MRRICFVITSFIHYSRSILVLHALRARADIHLSVILGGAALLPKYVSKRADIRADLVRQGITDVHETYFNLEGSGVITKAKTAGLGIIEFASLYDRIAPDVVLLRGDRFEVLAAATAAAYMNIPIAHIEGGDVSGTIDESVRHAITKLAHLHFATNRDARMRILRMGEDPRAVFMVGSPDVEVVRVLADVPVDAMDIDSVGSGTPIDVTAPFIMVMYHPVTTEMERLGAYTRTLIEAVHALDVPTIWFWPNFDAGADDIARELRVFHDTVQSHRIRFMRYLPPQHFLTLLRRTQCLVGNSSAGLKECSYLGIPVVNIGSRQQHRLRAGNVIDAPTERDAIRSAIAQQVQQGRYPTSHLYEAHGTSGRIAETIATAPLHVQKRFMDGVVPVSLASADASAGIRA